jgi:hypothetical protein
MTQRLCGLQGEEIMPLPGIEPQNFCHFTDHTVLAVCFEERYKDPPCSKGRSAPATVAARTRCQKIMLLVHKKNLNIISAVFEFKSV